MVQYDFNNLSSYEFENLTRDLLQEKFKIHIESFTEGKDGGIDLRFAQVKSSNAIIQCKKYKEFNSLYSNLKKEAKKIIEKKFERYYLVTSLGLTPHQKTEIFNLFPNIIETEADIFGRDDLNNFLGQYPQIEINYYKLWLSSSNVLEKILHSKIYNQSQFEIEEINEQIKIYVQNDSFKESLKILDENNFVIISGIPGIGKTTLARILVYHLLAKGFDEFIFLNENISEGHEKFNEDKKQIFLFDDFLGRNFLETSLVKNEEKSIAQFIKKIRKTKNKILIFTTREYILKQANLKFEIFAQSNLEKYKYIVDLSKYTKLVKAQILYNHLYFSNLTIEHIEEILKDNFYLRLVNHRNYNPRIIETFTKEKFWQNIGANDFPNKLISFFDNPTEVWKYAYQSQISNTSRIILAIMFTAGDPILYEDLFAAIQNFAKNLAFNKYKLKTSESDFKDSLKELEGTFIKIEKDIKENIVIEYQNPSIQDFLVNYLRENKDLIQDLIEQAIFYNQLTEFFVLKKMYTGRNVRASRRILLDKKQQDIYFDKIINEFYSLKSSYLSKRTYGKSTNEFFWVVSNLNILKRINLVAYEIPKDEHSRIYRFFNEVLNELLEDEETEIEQDEIQYFIKLISFFHEDIKTEPCKIIQLASANVICHEDLGVFNQIGEIYPDEYNEFIESESFSKVLKGVLEIELENYNENSLEDIIDILNDLGNTYGMYTSKEVKEIEEKIMERDNNEDWDYDKEEFYDREKENQFRSKKEENLEIDTMFSSLRNE